MSAYRIQSNKTTGWPNEYKVIKEQVSQVNTTIIK